MELYEILGLGAENLRAENTYLPHQAVSRQNKQMKIFEIKKWRVFIFPHELYTHSFTQQITSIKIILK